MSTCTMSQNFMYLLARLANNEMFTIYDKIQIYGQLKFEWTCGIPDCTYPVFFRGSIRMLWQLKILQEEPHCLVLSGYLLTFRVG